MLQKNLRRPAVSLLIFPVDALRLHWHNSDSYRRRQEVRRNLLLDLRNSFNCERRPYNLSISIRRKK